LKNLHSKISTVSLGKRRRFVRSNNDILQGAASNALSSQQFPHEDITPVIEARARRFSVDMACIPTLPIARWKCFSNILVAVHIEPLSTTVSMWLIMLPVFYQP
jgi:hypothetical protein